MTKPATFDGYSDQYTADCERVLVTLLRGLGPWKESVFLVGALTPRYLVKARPPEVPAHAGTLDSDGILHTHYLLLGSRDHGRQNGLEADYRRASRTPVLGAKVTLEWFEHEAPQQMIDWQHFNTGYAQ